MLRGEPPASQKTECAFFVRSHQNNCFSIVQGWYFEKTKLCVIISNFAWILGCLDWRILSILTFVIFFKNWKKWVHLSGILPFKKSIDGSELLMKSSTKDFLPENVFKSKFNCINYFQNLTSKNAPRRTAGKPEDGVCFFR